MADRQPTPGGGNAPIERHLSPDAPLVDLIFPNRTPEQHRGNPNVGAPAGSHRRRGSRLGALSGLLRRRTKVVHVASGRTGRGSLLADLPIRRRRLLMGIGTGAVAAAGVTGAAAL